MSQEQLSNLVNRLVAIQQTIVRKHEEDITPKLDYLVSSIAESLMGLKLQENIWVSARLVIVQELRSLLAQEARCLLPTNHFRRFVGDLFENELITSVIPTGINSDTANWLLLASPAPLKLLNFRDCDRQQRSEYSIEVELGEWRQVLQVSPSAQQPTEPLNEDWDCFFQWRQVMKQLNAEANGSQGFEPSQQVALNEEISCVVVYAAQLLHVSSLVNSFTYP